jgi:hypothetical protein
MGLRPLAYWNCGFESRLGHGCLSLVSVVCCQAEVSATSWSLVQRSPTEGGVSKTCVIVKPRKMRWPRPPTGCRAIEKKKTPLAVEPSGDISFHSPNREGRKLCSQTLYSFWNTRRWTNSKPNTHKHIIPSKESSVPDPGSTPILIFIGSIFYRCSKQSVQ